MLGCFLKNTVSQGVESNHTKFGIYNLPFVFNKTVLILSIVRSQHKKRVIFGLFLSILRGSNIEYFDLKMKRRQELFEKGALGFGFGGNYLRLTKI